MEEAPRYAAFISYSSKDAAFARRLHGAVEHYRIPKALGTFDLVGDGAKINRIFPVFRDREELPAGGLGAGIQAALRASRALLVVCSPNSVASPWVQKEIEYYAALGRRDRIFAIIAEDVDQGASGKECFPPALCGDFEPLAADARASRDGFRNAWLKLVAGMIGVNAGALQDRDERRRRAAFARNAVLTVLGAAAFGMAWLNYGVLSDTMQSWRKYRRFVESNAALMSDAPGATFQDCADGSRDCPLMVVVPEGEFLMGPSDPNPQLPLHPVSVPRFAVSKYEITFADWEACLAGGGCDGYAPYREGREGDERPVIHVSWSNAQSYVAWLSRMTGEDYRLLSEAEWEYAARGVTVADLAHHTRYSWGDETPVCDPGAPNGAVFYGCFDDGAQPVGRFAPNAFGLHDMHGNVWEWVEDCAGPFDPARTSAAPVLSEGCTVRVLRGGSWINVSYEIPSPYRIESIPSDRSFHEGFRVARTIRN